MTKPVRFICMLAALFVASSAFADNAAALRELTVRVVADQTFSRMSGWERKAKEQFDFVAEDIEKVLGVRITIIGYSEWTHNEEPNLFGLASRMVNEVPPEGADILVGFTLSPRRSPKERVRTDGVTIPYRGTMLRWYQGSRDHNFFLPYILFHEMVHIFGGVHVRDGGLMSPLFTKNITLRLDSLNREIISLTRDVDFRAGLASLGHGTLERLAEIYEEVSDQGNQEISLFLELGDIYRELDKPEKAIRSYGRILEFDPTNEIAVLNLADLLGTHGRADKAVAIMRRFVSSRPDNVFAWEYLARAHYRNNELNEAAEAYETALRFMPHESGMHLYYNLGIIYDSLGQSEKALNAFQNVTEIEPQLVNGWLQLGDCYYKSGNVDRAVKTFEKAARVTSEKGLFYSKLAVLHFNEGEYEKARSNARLAEAHGSTIDPALWDALKARERQSH